MLNGDTTSLQALLRVKIVPYKRLNFVIITLLKCTKKSNQPGRKLKKEPN